MRNKARAILVEDAVRNPKAQNAAQCCVVDTNIGREFRVGNLVRGSC